MNDSGSETAADYLNAEEERRRLEQRRRELQGLTPSWRTALATIGVAVGFFGGIIFGLLSLRSLGSWKQGDIPRPTFAWVIGTLALAIIGGSLVYGAITCSPSAEGLLGAAGIGVGVGTLVFGNPRWRLIGLVPLFAGIYVGLSVPC